MEKAVQALLIVWISPMEQMGWFRKELYPLGGEAIYYRSIPQLYLITNIIFSAK